MGSIFDHPHMPFLRWFKRLLLLGLILACYLAAQWFIEQFLAASPMLSSSWQTWLIPIGLVLYILLMMLPFMPGIEIGFALLMLLGKDGSLIVYLATVLALSSSFCIGRLIPPALIIRLLGWLNLDAAVQLVHTLEPMPPSQRQAFLEQQLPDWLASILIRNRYLTLAALLNLPGNALLGGGGGICITAGMSQLMSLRAFVLVIALAVLPIPLGFYLFSG